MSNINNDLLRRFNAMHSFMTTLFSAVTKLAEENSVLKPLADQAYLIIRDNSSVISSPFVSKKTIVLNPKLEIKCLELMTNLVKNEQWGESPNILYSKEHGGELGGAMNIANKFFGVEYKIKICISAHESVVVNEAMAIVIVLFDQGFQNQSITERIYLFGCIEKEYPNEYLKRVMELLGWFDQRS